MKKFTFLLGLLFVFVSLNAQNYKISFKGTGESNTVDSVEVKNLTRETTLKLSGADTLLLSGTIGIEDIDFEEGMLVYPNPATQMARIRFGSSSQGKVQITVSEISGKTILYNEMILSRGTHTFSVSGLKTGIYMLHVVTAMEAYTKKLILMGANIEAPALTYEGSVYNTVSKTRQKSSRNVAIMHYKNGERLLFKGKSMQYATVLTLVPASSQQVTFNFVECMDADSNYYAVVRIGWQTWMAENLKTTRYQNGEPIYKMYYASQRNTLYRGSYCWYNNNEATYKNIYGALYNQYTTVNPDILCPAGWVVPATWDWQILTDHLGDNAGGKMKATGTEYWDSPNSSATNESGFTGLPGGARNIAGYYGQLGEYGHWWSSTHNDFITGWHRSLYHGNGYIGANSFNNDSGFSVRCIKIE